MSRLPKKDTAIEILAVARRAASAYQWHMPSVLASLREAGYRDPAYALSQAEAQQLTEAEAWIDKYGAPPVIADEIRRLVSDCAFSAEEAARVAVAEHNRRVRDSRRGPEMAEYWGHPGSGYGKID